MTQSHAEGSDLDAQAQTLAAIAPGVRGGGAHWGSSCS